jgi:hypothetical protein
LFTFKHVENFATSHSMPPPKKGQAEPDPNRVCTRAGNATTHPGIAAKDALRVRNPPRDPDVVLKEKLEKDAKKVAKQKATEEMQAKEEVANNFVKEYRARKEAETLDEGAAIPRQKPKG